MKKIIPLDVEAAEEPSRRYWRLREELAEKARAGAATIEDYMAQGYTDVGARWMVERDAKGAKPLPGDGPSPSSGFIEAHIVSATPFCSGNEATFYEWVMHYADREPYSPWLGDSVQDPNDGDARWRLMCVFAEEASLNLCADLKDGRIRPDRWAYRRNSRGDTVGDITRSVFSRKTMLDFFARIGGYGTKIAKMLAERHGQNVTRR